MISSTAILTALLAARGPSYASTTREATKDVLPFIVDDYPKALARARAENKPIFLETWAPW